MLINVYVAGPDPDPDPDPNPRGGGQLPNPYPNDCNSTLTSGTNNIYPYPYIDVNDRGHTASDRGHRLRVTHTLRRSFGMLPKFFRKFKYFSDRLRNSFQFLGNRI